jgi:hypothetical protein
MGQQYKAGTEFKRLPARHCRVNTETPRLVVAGGNYTPALGTAANRQGNMAQTGIVAHFNGGKKTISIAVDNFFHGGGTVENTVFLYSQKAPM